MEGDSCGRSLGESPGGILGSGVGWGAKNCFGCKMCKKHVVFVVESGATDYFV